jgi:hypothetical protein
MMQKQAKTRAEYKQLKLQERKKTGYVLPAAEAARAARPVPFWLRFVIFVCLILIFTVAGAMVGYGHLGNRNAFDVLKVSTWTHIRDLVNQ